MLKMRLTGHERINRITRTNDDTTMHKVSGISPIVDMVNTGDPMASARLMTTPLFRVLRADLARNDLKRVNARVTSA